MTKYDKNYDDYRQRRYDYQAKKFEDDASILLASEHGLRRRVETFLRIFQSYVKNGKKKILDVGCGLGTYSKLLSELGHEVTGIDTSEHMIKKAIERSAGKSIIYKVGNIYSLPFDDNCFDVAICISVIPYISNEIRALREIRRTLKANGILMLETLSSVSISVPFKKLIAGKADETTPKARRYNPFKLTKVVADTGFNYIEMKGVYIFPKMLRKLDAFLETSGVFSVIDRNPVSMLFAHSFFIIARKSDMVGKN